MVTMVILMIISQQHLLLCQDSWLKEGEKNLFDCRYHYLARIKCTRLLIPTLRPRARKNWKRVLSQVTQNRQYMMLVMSTSFLHCLLLWTQPKEKRKELGKHIQQRKRKSLSDLFKILSSIGMMGNDVILFTTAACRLADFWACFGKLRIMYTF